MAHTTKTCFVTPGATATTAACITTATNVLGASKTFEVVVDDLNGSPANNPVGNFQFYVDGVLVGYKAATADAGGGTISSRATFTLSTLAVGSRALTATFVPSNAAQYTTSCAGASCTSSGLTDTVTARTTSSATLSALSAVTVRTPQTPTITVTDQAGAINGTFTTSASYAITARSGHTARLLPDGRIFVFGGQAAGVLLASGGAQMISTAGVASAYAPGSGTFTAVTDGTATVLQDGTVLLAGGSDGTNALATAYIFDPVAGSVTATTGNLQTARKNHAATLLNDGKVLITGGTDSAGTALATPNMVEIYDPAAGTFAKVTGDMTVARAGHTATLLRTGANAGAVLLAGGGDASFEIYTVTGATTGSSSATVAWAGAVSDHTATSLPDGNILLAGGGAAGTTTAQLYDVVNNTIVDVTTSAHPLATGRTGHTATLLSDGTVVLIGGLNAASTAIGTAEIYVPSYDPQGPVTLASSPVDTTNLTLTGCTLSLSGTGAASCTGTVNPIHYGSASYSVTATYATTTNHTNSTSTVRTLNVSQKSITVTAVADTKTYDSTTAGAATPATPTGLAGDTITVAQDFNSKDVATASYSIPRVVSILDGTSADVSGDYSVILTNSAPASSSITRRAITVIATAGSKVYGASDPALAFTVGGLGYAGTEAAANAFTGSLARATGETVAGGPYAISNGTLAATNNYSYTSATDFTSANFTITARPITVTVDPGQTKVYGDNDPTLTFTVGGSGLANNPSISVVDNNATVFTGTISRAAGETVTGGPYAIGQNTLAANSNYNLTSFTGANFAITARPITVTVNSSQSKVYGENDPTLAFTVGGSGLANNPGISVVDNNATVFTGAISRAAGETVAGGPYAIGQNTLAANSNYNLTTFTGANFAITARPIAVTVDGGQSKTYGNSDPTLTYTAGAVSGNPVSGLAVNLGLGINDTQAGVFSGTLGRAAGETVSGGPYAITQGSVAPNSNYSLAPANFTGATFAITARPITVTVDAGQTKVYGNNDPTLTFTVGGSGLANNLGVAVDTQATAFTGAVSRVAGETVTGGPYAIGQNTLAANSNYNLTSFTGSTFAITARPITVTVDPGQTKVYGNTDPTLTFTVGGNGLANNPGISVVDNNATVFTGAIIRAAGENVGTTYAITQNTLAANSNYNLTTFTGANFSITQRPVTVTADAGQTKVYGTADPGAFTYSITSGTLAFTDAFTGALSRAAGESVATYAIGLNTLTLGSNYNLTYVGANFAITQRPVTITANSGQTKIYGTADPVFTYAITSGSLAFTDNFTGVLARAAGETVGSYAIGQGTVTLGANYNLSYLGANFTITKASASTVVSPTTAANYDVPVTFTATVTSGTTGVPTGTVNFFDGATLLGSGTLNGSGVATYTTTTSGTAAVAQLAAGPHTITAVYTGDPNFSASPTSPAVTQTINKTAASTVVSPVTAATYDVAVTFTATVTSATTGIPTGTVDFFDGATKIGTGTLNTSGVATYTSTTSATTAVAQLAAGSHPITAVYTGDANFNASPASPSVTQTINKAGTTSVVATTAASTYDVAVTFTATVTSATTGVPTGTVNFFDGATLIGSGVLNASGVATYTTTTSASTAVAQLAAGSHPITAVFTGDSNFNVSPASATMTHTVNKAAVSTLVSPTTPADYDVPVTFTATVTSATAGIPTGTVDFFDGTLKIGTGTLNALGVATYTSTTSTTTTLAQLAVGSHPITAVYNGDANYTVSPASAIVAQIINKTSTTTVVTPTAASTYDVAVTFTATVTSATTGVPTGTVDFFDGTLKIGTGTLDTTGVATYTTTTSSTVTVAQLAAGNHTITAVYNGDANYGVSPASAAITHTVNKAGVTSVVTPTTPTAYNVAVTFTATVTSATTGVPTGTIDFFDGALKIGSGTLNASGVATYTTTTSASAAVAQLAAGAHPITAVYNGDSNFNVSPASATMTHTVNQTVTSLSIASGTNPSIYGTTFTLSTVVTSATTGVPTGTVDFFDGTTKLGTVTVDASGAASYTTSAAQALSMLAGAHTLNAVYSGDANYLTVTSANLPQTISQAATTSALTTAANPNIFGTPLVITATVTSATTGVPTGTVTIFEQGVTTPLATNVPLVNGVATYSTTAAQQQSMTNGHHILFFTYSGDANYVTSTAPTFDESIGLAATASVITSPGASVFGEPVIFSVTVTAPGTTVIPVGTVNVLDGTTLLGTVTLDLAGKATYQTTPAQALAMGAGSHSITAQFNGNPNFVTSTSPVYTQAVNKAGSATALLSQLSLNASGNGVYTFTSTLNWVTSASTKGTPLGTAGIPSGTVNIRDNGSVIVSNLPLVLNTTTGVSVATSAPIQLAAGQHKITIDYNGDANFLSIVSEASAPISVLSLLNTSLQPSSTPYPQTLPVSYAGTGTVKLTTALDPCSNTSSGPCVSYNFATKLPTGFTAAEQVGCVVTSVGPVTAPPTCSIDVAGSHLPLTLSSTSLSGAVVIKINTTTLTNVRMRPAPRPGSNRTLDLYGLTLGMPAIVFMGLAVPAGRRRRKVLRGSPMSWLGLILVVAILLGALGCGGGSFSNPKNAQPVLTSGSTTAGTYTAVVYYTPQGCTTGSCAQAIASVDFSVVQ